MPMLLGLIAFSWSPRVKRRFERHCIARTPIGADIRTESTDVNTIWFPHEIISGLLLLRIMVRGIEHSAACTVALGIQAKATKRRSLNDRADPLVAKYAVATLIASPIRTMAVPLNSSSFLVRSKSKAAPIVPNNNGLIAMFQITPMSFPTLCICMVSVHEHLLTLNTFGCLHIIFATAPIESALESKTGQTLVHVPT